LLIVPELQIANKWGIKKNSGSLQTPLLNPEQITGTRASVLKKVVWDMVMTKRATVVTISK
jgi:hypothetical protein